MSTNHRHSSPRHGHGGHKAHQHEDEAGMAEMLDLDARLLQGHLQEIFDWTARLRPDPRSILDLGAGTGTGTLGLARTFPGAAVVALDQSEYMLQRLAAKIEAHGLGGRASILQVDLDRDWPATEALDLIWAASSMHHLGDPARVFERIGATLSAEGMLVVVEMDELPRYLPAELGFGTPGLEERCRNAVDSNGWNAHPDWTRAIGDAGMQVVEKRTFSYATEADAELVARNAHRFLSGMRAALQDSLPAEDLKSLALLLDDAGPHSVLKRTDLSMRGSRTAWAARVNQA